MSQEPQTASQTRSEAKANEQAHWLHSLVKIGLRFRYINLLAVGCSFVGALCMCGVGLLKTVRAIMVFFSDDYAKEQIAAAVTKYVVQAMDAFVFAMVLVVFSTSIFHLFIRELKAKDFRGLKGFERVQSIHHLKQILSQLIIVLLFVHFLKLTIEGNLLEWEFLIIPAGALLMAIALKLLDFGGHANPSSKET